jgi:hypothetical protein
MSLAGAAFQLSPSLWADEILGFKPDDLQRQVLDSDSKRIIINCHRQWGKSTISSIACLHRALFYPKSLCLIIAPSLRQSSENFRKVHSFLDRLPDCPEFDESTKLSLQFDTGSRILSLPGGNEGATIRGFSKPDIIIEDESSRCSDELYHALRPMMAANPDCKLVLASTPWGQRGHFYKIWTESEEDGWHQLDPRDTLDRKTRRTNWLKAKIVASHNPRIDPAFLEEERAALGPWVYAQEYEGEFVGDESQLFTLSMIRAAHNTDIPMISLGGY